MGFGMVFKYLDNVVGIISAISAFTVHRDLSTLARQIARQIYDAVDETLPVNIDDYVSKQSILEGVENLVNSFEPLLGMGDGVASPGVPQAPEEEPF